MDPLQPREQVQKPQTAAGRSREVLQAPAGPGSFLGRLGTARCWAPHRLFARRRSVHKVDPGDMTKLSPRGEYIGHAIQMLATAYAMQPVEGGQSLKQYLQLQLCGMGGALDMLVVLNFWCVPRERVTVCKHCMYSDSLTYALPVTSTDWLFSPLSLLRNTQLMFLASELLQTGCPSMDAKIPGFATSLRTIRSIEWGRFLMACSDPTDFENRRLKKTKCNHHV